MWAELIGGAGCACGAFTAYGVRGRSARLFGPSVHRGLKGRRALALTFDDGPSESTPALLELLEKYRVRATFFQCGMNVKRLRPVARETALLGHEIGNHTYSHPLFCFRSAKFIQDELERAQDEIARASGANPSLFRAPYGARWFGLREAQRRLKLLGVMWTVMGRDWKLPPVGIAERVIRRASEGAIICLHDGRELQHCPDISSTIEAVRRIIPALLERGYRFETVSELLCPQN